MTIDNSNETLQPERAFYELVHLMRYYHTTTNDQHELVMAGTTEQLQALAGYSQEISQTLLWGLQSIGRLMANAVQNETAGYLASDVADTSNFISLVANCIEATNEIGYFAREELQRRS
jgi:hypothetical protein